jgi:hypothetical protein
MTLVWVCLDRAVLEVISSSPNDDIDARAAVSSCTVILHTFSSEAISISWPALRICTVFASRCGSACIANLGMVDVPESPPMKCKLSRSKPWPLSSTRIVSFPLSRLIQHSIRVAPASKEFWIDSFSICEKVGMMTADLRREWTGRANGVIPRLAGLSIGYICQRRLAFEPIVSDY